MKSPRCRYCHKDATVWFRRSFTYSKMGHRRSGTVIVAACAEHEDCANFRSHLDLHQNIELERSRSEQS